MSMLTQSWLDCSLVPSGSLAYALPPQGNVWVHLGTLETTMNGNLSQLEIVSQNSYATTATDFVLSKLLFTTTDGTVSQQALDDNSGLTSPSTALPRSFARDALGTIATV